MIEKPHRIQRKRTKGWRMPPNTVYVGRGSVFGNPCVCQKPYSCPRFPEFERWAWEDDDGNISPLRCCVDVYRHYVETGIASQPTCTGRLNFALEGLAGYPFRKKLVDALPRLRGKNLACWCPLDQPCHADVLLEIANQEEVVDPHPTKSQTTNARCPLRGGVRKGEAKNDTCYRVRPASKSADI